MKLRAHIFDEDVPKKLGLTKAEYYQQFIVDGQTLVLEFYKDGKQQVNEDIYTDVPDALSIPVNKKLFEHVVHFKNDGGFRSWLKDAIAMCANQHGIELGEEALGAKTDEAIELLKDGLFNSKNSEKNKDLYNELVDSFLMLPLWVQQICMQEKLYFCAKEDPGKSQFYLKIQPFSKLATMGWKVAAAAAAAGSSFTGVVPNDVGGFEQKARNISLSITHLVPSLLQGNIADLLDNKGRLDLIKNRYKLRLADGDFNLKNKIIAIASPDLQGTLFHEVGHAIDFYVGQHTAKDRKEAAETPFYSLRQNMDGILDTEPGQVGRVAAKKMKIAAHIATYSDFVKPAEIAAECMRLYFSICHVLKNNHYSDSEIDKKLEAYCKDAPGLGDFTGDLVKEAKNMVEEKYPLMEYEKSRGR